MFAEADQQVFRHHPPVLGGRVEEDDGEDRAPVARDVVLAAKAVTQAGGNLAQDLVSGTAVEPLVDPAEVVRAEQQQDRGPRALLDVGERRFELGLEAGPLGQLRDLIESGAGDGPRVRREAGGETQEPLPPALVAERVGGGGKPQKVASSSGGIAVEPQADQGRQLRGGGTIGLSPLGAGRLFLHPRHQPAQRDPVEQALGATAGEAALGVVLPRQIGAEPPIRLRRRLRIGQLGKRTEPALVDQDALLSCRRGNVE